MKIHLDYLEGRIEELENTNLKLTTDKKLQVKKYEEKLKALQIEKDKEIEQIKNELGKMKEKDGKLREEI